MVIEIAGWSVDLVLVEHVLEAAANAQVEYSATDIERTKAGLDMAKSIAEDVTQSVTR